MNTAEPLSTEALDRLGQRVIADVTSLLISSGLRLDYEHARALAEGFVLGQPNMIATYARMGADAARRASDAQVAQLREDLDLVLSHAPSLLKVPGAWEATVVSVLEHLAAAPAPQPAPPPLDVERLAKAIWNTSGDPEGAPWAEMIARPRTVSADGYRNKAAKLAAEYARLAERKAPETGG